MAEIIRGKAALTWVDADDPNTERVLLLREPLREWRPAHVASVYRAMSLDAQTLQTFTVGSGVDELVGRLRFSDQPQSLLDLIKAGSKQRTITYFPTLADPNRNYACYLVAPLSPLTLGLDPATGTSSDDLDVELRFRRTTATSFGSDVFGQAVFLDYRAGGNTSLAIFSRASVAGYIDKFGIFNSAAVNKPRIHWVDLDADKVRETPTLLLEAAATNKLTFPEDLSNAAWTKSGTTIPSTNNTSPRNDPTASFVREDTSSGVHQAAQTFTRSAAGNPVGLTAFAKANGRNDVEFILDGGSTYILVRATLTGNGTVASTGTAAPTFYTIVALASGWYMLQIFGAPANTTTVSWVARLHNGSTDSYTGDGVSGAFVWGCVATDNQIAGMYWGTGASRSADSLSFPWPYKPQAMWRYAKFIESGVSTSGRAWQIGKSDDSNPRTLIYESGSTLLALYHHNGTASVEVSVTRGNVGDVTELLALIYSDGSIELLRSLNGGATTSSGRSPALVFASAWSDQVTWINSSGATQIGVRSYIGDKAGPGTAVNTMALARAWPF